MQILSLALSLAIILAQVGCGSPTPPALPVNFTTVHKAQGPNLFTKGRFHRLITGPAEFDALIREQGDPNVFDRSSFAGWKVDFATQAVIVVTSGYTGNTCYHVAIESIQQDPEGLDLVVRHTEPRPGQGCGEAMTNPVHAVTVDRGALPPTPFKATFRAPGGAVLETQDVKELASPSAQAEAPPKVVVAPVQLDRGGTEVRWEADGARKLRYQVRLLLEGESHPAVMLETAETRAELREHLDRLPAGSYWLEVHASDGLNSGHARVGPLTLVPRAPRLVIQSKDPEPLVLFMPVASHLTAYASDEGYNPLPVDEVRWRSDLSGEFGRGARASLASLPAGEHTVTASLTGPGGTSTATVRVRLVDPDAMTEARLEVEDAYVNKSSNMGAIIVIRWRIHNWEWLDHIDVQVDGKTVHTVRHDAFTTFGDQSWTFNVPSSGEDGLTFVLHGRDGSTRRAEHTPRPHE